ncbi:hypothetical protein MG293_004974 [Ovis ammon polii]|uniref:Uncharacterized protein n=1 Tax=Ovis ammon polii TaxID=230172 RepID=A0AAD4YE82_OVIAM|nr:hypothetical protein MG293_004974 [Ovis ammon polii]
MRDPDPLPSIGAAPPASPFQEAIYFTPGLQTKGGKPGVESGAAVSRAALGCRSCCRMAAGRRRRAASPGAQRLLPGIGTGEHAKSRGPRVPTACSSVHRPGTGPYGPLQMVPRKRPGAAALLVHSAPRTAGSQPTRLLGA